MQNIVSLNTHSESSVIFEKTASGEAIPFKVIQQTDTPEAFGGGKNPDFYVPLISSAGTVVRRVRPRPGSPTQLASARKGEITPEMQAVALRESMLIERFRENLNATGNRALAGKLNGVLNRIAPVTEETVCREIAARRTVLPLNFLHPEAQPMIIGARFKTKINANIGTSDSIKKKDDSEELTKLREAIDNGADTVMDLSIGKDIVRIREAILRNSPVPVGTVPIYEVLERAGSVENISWELFADVMENQAKQGVDYMTIHAGLLLPHLPLTRTRLCGIVSRGGGILAQWMHLKHKENFLFTHFDEILEIARHYDITLSLGDGLRPGSILDGTDAAQLAELQTLAELNRRAGAFDVQVMIEGPGHIRQSDIAANAQLEKIWCEEAPFYTLGPLVCDIGAGYDHITAAIGASEIASHGAAMLCYVTPKEHLGLPNSVDVREGMAAFRIAAHAADIVRGTACAELQDALMSIARFEFRWRDQYALALNSQKAQAMREETLSGSGANEAHFCSMCGPKFCPMKIARDLFGEKERPKD